MQITKTEFNALKDEISELKTMLALHWTEPVLPDIEPPKHDDTDKLRKGFLYNVPSMRVEPACTSFIYHAFGRDDQTTSQGSVSLYSTRKKALQALRYDLEMKAALGLNRIDKLIEKDGER